MSHITAIVRKTVFALMPLTLLAGVLTVGPVTMARAALLFRLNPANLVIDNPSPLFSTSAVSGTLTLQDTVAPAAGFGVSQITGFSFNFGGIVITLPDTAAPGGTLTAFGTRSADGLSLSFLDLRFDLSSSILPCDLICAGQIQIATFDRSNFVAINDANALTTSLLTFDAALVVVPEPDVWALFGVMLGGMAMSRRLRSIVRV